MIKKHRLIRESNVPFPRELLSEKRRVQILKTLKLKGVVLPDDLRCSDIYIESTVEVEAGAWIAPHNYIFGKSVIRASVAIGPMNTIVDSVVEKGCAIGSFVQLVRSRIGEGTTIRHKSYVGDTEMGKRCNVGADSRMVSDSDTDDTYVVTCNYDGVKKHKTVIEDDVFVGSGVKIIAPRTVGAKAYIASKTLVTEDVPRGTTLGYLVRRKNGKQVMEKRVRKMREGWVILARPAKK